MHRWLATGLGVAALTTGVAACGDDDAGTPSAATTASTVAASCGETDLNRGVISRFEVRLLSRDRGRATFVLSRDAEVGVTGFRRLLGRRVPKLRLVGRVPFGPQRSAVVNQRAFALPRPGGRPLPPGQYQLTLRAFESGKLGKGAPIDTKSACLTLP